MVRAAGGQLLHDVGDGTDRFHNPVRGPEGKVAAVIGISTDITERKRDEDALRRRAEELVALHETVLDITGRHDLPELLRSILERATKLLTATGAGLYICYPEKGELRYEVSYRTLTEFLGTVLKYGEGAAGRVAQTGEPLIIEDYRTWPGRAAAYEKSQPFSAVLCAPMIWQDETIGVIDILDDNESRRFTESDLKLLGLFANHAAIALENARHSENLERMVAERTAKLADSQHQLQLMADSLPAVISYVDPQQRYRFNNKAYEEWFGQSPNQIIGRHVREVLGENGYERIHRRLEAALLGERQSFEYELTLRSGTRNISATYIPDLGEQGQVRGVFVLGIDITERKRMEERLLRSERLAAIGETAAMVGHDLRNPLQGIAGAIHLLKQESLTAEERNEMLQVIEKSVHYSDSIIRDLSDYSAEIQLKLAEATPKSITRDAIGAVKVPQNVTVQDLSEDQPTLRVDPDRMKRVFINLIENAIDAMPQGGTLTISSKKSDGNVRNRLDRYWVGYTGEGYGESLEAPPNHQGEGAGFGIGDLQAHCGRSWRKHISEKRSGRRHDFHNATSHQTLWR